MSGPVVVLAGGTGGAKLARGLLEVVGPDELVVVANTADDVEIYGAYVSPDPDLVTFWLAGIIDERGWGIEGDTFHVMDGLRALGVDVWFSLGDRDLAIGLERARALDAGARLTEAHAAITSALGVRARVLPMADQPVRTQIMAQGRWWPFQEYMIRTRGVGPIEGVEFRGVRAARATPEVLAAIASARAIIIGPSNPVISIGPMLAIAGLRDAVRGAAGTVVAVSPIVRGTIVKGPTAAFMAWAQASVDSAGIASLYGPLLDGLVADQPTAGVPVLETDVAMSDAAGRVRLAEEVVRFAGSVRRRRNG